MRREKGGKARRRKEEKRAPGLEFVVARCGLVPLFGVLCNHAGGNFQCICAVTMCVFCAMQSVAWARLGL